MCSLNENIINSLSTKTFVPLVIRGYVKNYWNMCNWDIKKWCSVFGDNKLPFRCLRENLKSDEPCWERKCEVKNMTFTDFVACLPSAKEWMYFDYKYVHQWFEGDNNEFCKGFSWKEFGYPDKGASASTVWVGSEGAHTPAHRDTYGVNIIAQVYGKKRWILFPPDTTGLRPTRVPYEESSIYSELNFYCPKDLEAFSGLTGARMVELSAGDALLVPRGWWHYVQNLDQVNISINVWLPHEKDTSTQVSEALIKLFVAQICKDMPRDTAKLLVNPNEDDISETPLAVLFLQLETVTNTYLASKRKSHRAKRQKPNHDLPTTSAEYDLQTLLDNKDNNLEIVPNITNEDLIKLLKRNIEKFAGTSTQADEDDVDGSTSNLGLTKAVIEAFCESNVIDAVRQNLLAKLS